MNVEASTPPQSITQIASPEQLVTAREARGWSMSDVAAKLGMMPRQIDAIENGRWEALPGAAFVRGAIRAYGKALQLDVAPLLSTLGAQSGTPELRPSSSLDSPLPRHGALGFDNGGSGSRIVWIVLGVIGVIAIAMYFGRGADFGQVLEPGSGPGRTVEVVPVAPGASSTGGAGDAARPGSSASTRAPAARPDAAVGSATTAVSPATGASTASGASDAPGVSGASAPGASTSPAAPTSTTATPAAAQPASSSAAGSAAVAGSGGATAPTTAPSAAAGSDAASTASTASAEGATTAAAAPASEPAKDAAAAGAAPVVLRFERESWVDVRDASGKVLLMGTQPANSTREISGQKPYSLTIGNAAFVRVEHGGRNVDLGAVTQKGVARVRVE